MTYSDIATRIELRPGALAAWRARFGTEPKEPLETRGGALDPGAWCMQLAAAVADGRPLPGYSKDEGVPASVVQEVRAALDAEIKEGDPT